MRKSLIFGMAVVALGLTLSACSTSDPEPDMATATVTETMEAPMTSEEPMHARSGTFMGLNDKNVEGMVMVTDTEITLTGFSSDEAPDLHVYLTNGTDETAVDEGVKVDKVAFDGAMQTFTLDGVDVESYDTVVIHCDKAKAVFGAAALS